MTVFFFFLYVIMVKWSFWTHVTVCGGCAGFVRHPQWTETKSTFQVGAGSRLSFWMSLSGPKKALCCFKATTCLCIFENSSWELALLSSKQHIRYVTSSRAVEISPAASQKCPNRLIDKSAPCYSASDDIVGWGGSAVLQSEYHPHSDLKSRLCVEISSQLSSTWHQG